MSSNVNALHINSGERKKNVICRHCGYPHRSEDCRFSHLACSFCNKKRHLKHVCRLLKESNQGPKSSQDQIIQKSSEVKGQSNNFYQKKQRYKKKVNAVSEVSDSVSEASDSSQLLVLRDIASLIEEKSTLNAVCDFIKT